MTQYEQGFEDCKKQAKAAMVLVVEEAILMEREACAKLCEEQYEYYGYDHVFAAAIRARGAK